MKTRITIDRNHYEVTIDVSDDEIKDIKKRIAEVLAEIDNAIRESTGVWHSPMYEDDLFEFLPTGAVKFDSGISNQIDQLLILTAAGGTFGIRVSEASNLLRLPSNKVSSKFTDSKTKFFFRKLEEGRYALSKEGLSRYRTFLLEVPNEEDVSPDDESV